MQLVRRAALDGQSYVIAPGVAYCEDDPVPLHGKSLVAVSIITHAWRTTAPASSLPRRVPCHRAQDPWGRIVSQCDESGDGIALAEVDPRYIEEVRQKLPIAALAAKF